MSIVGSGQVALSDIEGEFGGDSPTSLSEYYRNGDYTTGNNTGVPEAGAISFSDFYGAEKQSLSLVTSNYEAVSEGDTTHTFPTGIQSGDLLIMLQTHASADSSTEGSGFGGTDIRGNGFTVIGTRKSSGYSEQWFYKPSHWATVETAVSYKIASGSESGASIGGFAVPSNAASDTYGSRRLYVVRPTYANSGTVADTYASNLTTSTDQPSVPSHTISASLTPSASLPSVGLVLFAAAADSKTVSLSGGVSALDDTYTASRGSDVTRSIHYGLFFCDAGTTQITAAGEVGSTYAEGVSIATLTVS